MQKVPIFYFVKGDRLETYSPASLSPSPSQLINWFPPPLLITSVMLVQNVLQVLLILNWGEILWIDAKHFSLLSQ